MDQKGIDDGHAFYPIKPTTSHKYEGSACTRCRKHKIKCSKTRPCSTCSRMGVAGDCDATFGISACWPCRRSKLKCDKQRPCSTCMRRGRSSECLVMDEEMRQIELEIEEDDFASDAHEFGVVVRSEVLSPHRPWPLQLQMELDADFPRTLGTDECKDMFSQFIFRTSQIGFDYTSILFMFNTMGEDLSSTFRALLQALVGLRESLFSNRPKSPSPLPMAGSVHVEGFPICFDPTSSSSWTVRWKPNGFMRTAIKVGRGLGHILGRNPEEILARAARCEMELPSSDVEFLCMLLDELFCSAAPLLVRYQRMCRRSADGRLEESSLVKTTSQRIYDEFGNPIFSTHTVEILPIEEWDRIHNDPKEMKLYMQLRTFLGEETKGEELLLSHKRDILFDEHFATLNQSEAGRQKLRKIANFVQSKLELMLNFAKLSQAGIQGPGSAAPVPGVVGPYRTLTAALTQWRPGGGRARPRPVAGSLSHSSPATVPESDPVESLRGPAIGLGDTVTKFSRESDFNPRAPGPRVTRRRSVPAEPDRSRRLTQPSLPRPPPVSGSVHAAVPRAGRR
eukprot:765364-Hanusia_phi.AAC.3